MLKPNRPYQRVSGSGEKYRPDLLSSSLLLGAYSMDDIEGLFDIVADSVEVAGLYQVLADQLAADTHAGYAGFKPGFQGFLGTVHPAGGHHAHPGTGSQDRFDEGRPPYLTAGKDLDDFATELFSLRDLRSAAAAR